MSKIPGPVANGGPPQHGQETRASQEVRQPAPRKTAHGSPPMSKEKLGGTDTGSAGVPKTTPGKLDMNGMTASVDSVVQNDMSTGDMSSRRKSNNNASNGSLQRNSVEQTQSGATIQSEQDDVAPMPKNKKLSAVKSVARYVMTFVTYTF